jgi:hypothetical protein
MQRLVAQALRRDTSSTAGGRGALIGRISRNAMSVRSRLSSNATVRVMVGS